MICLDNPEISVLPSHSGCNVLLVWAAGLRRIERRDQEHYQE